MSSLCLLAGPFVHEPANDYGRRKPPFSRPKRLRFVRTKGHGSPPKVTTATKFPTIQQIADSGRVVGTGTEPGLGCNTISIWPIALRARASPVRNVGRGSSSHSQPRLDQTKKSSERAAQYRSVGRNLNSMPMRHGFLNCRCLFSSVATSFDLNCADGANVSLESTKGQRHAH